MSTPEEIQSGTQSEKPMDVAGAIAQLRALVCGLGAALIIVSVVLSGFLFKQNRDLTAGMKNRHNQTAQLQGMLRPMEGVLSELAKYSSGKPELMALFAKHGLQFTPNPAAGQPASAPNH